MVIMSIFLIQFVPSLSLTMIIRIIKSITAKEIYRLCLQLKKKLLVDNNMWGARYFVSMCCKNGTEHQIKNYIID